MQSLFCKVLLPVLETLKWTKLTKTHSVTDWAFGQIVKMLSRIFTLFVGRPVPAVGPQILCQLSANVYPWKGSSDSWSDWVPTTQLGDRDWVPHFNLALAIVGVLAVNQNISLSASETNKIRKKIHCMKKNHAYRFFTVYWTLAFEDFYIPASHSTCTWAPEHLVKMKSLLL